MILMGAREPRSSTKPPGTCRVGRCLEVGTVMITIRWPAGSTRVVRVCDGHEYRAQEVARALGACAEVTINGGEGKAR